MQVIGHLGKDATVNEVNGKSVINFTVAHSEKWKAQDGTQNEKTIWVDCAYWVDRDFLSQYLIKGTQVYAEGMPEVRTYTANDGTTKAVQNMRVFHVQLLGGGGNKENNQSKPEQAQKSKINPNTTAPDYADPDDLPF